MSDVVGGQGDISPSLRRSASNSSVKSECGSSSTLTLATLSVADTAAAGPDQLCEMGEYADRHT